MAYRDEGEALRARVEQLEGELDEARREIGRLKGGEDTRVEEAMARGGASTRWFGAPAHLRLRRTVEGELPAERLDELVDILRERFSAVGSIQKGGRGLAWTLGPPASNRIVEITVVPSNGRTVIRVTERLANLAGGMFGGIVGGLGGGGLGVVVPITAWLAPLAAPVAAAVWLLTVYGGVRVGYRSNVRKRASELGAVADDLAAACRDALEGAPVRARVAATDGNAVEEVSGYSEMRRRGRGG